MRNGKKAGYIVILRVVIVGATIFGIRTLKRGAPDPPKWYMDRPIEMMDSATFEVITRGYGEWLKLGREDTCNSQYINRKGHLARRRGLESRMWTRPPFGS